VLETGNQDFHLGHVLLFNRSRLSLYWFGFHTIWNG
jgi:hypothetical protein